MSDNFFIDFILLKDLFNYVLNLIWAFIKAGEDGIGRNRIKFHIEYILDANSNEKIYENRANKLEQYKINIFDIKENNKELIKEDTEEGEEKDKERVIELDFYSPLRSRSKNKILSNII